MRELRIPCDTSRGKMMGRKRAGRGGHCGAGLSASPGDPSLSSQSFNKDFVLFPLETWRLRKVEKLVQHHSQIMRLKTKVQN